jgi:microcystin-dependent protein
MDTPFLGMVMPFAGNFAPRGWVSCEGQLLAIQQNAALFSLLGTSYGGNGTSTFALPDLRGRAVIGQGMAPGLSPYSTGQKGGTENTTISINNLPPHTHTITIQANGDGSSASDPTNDYLAVAPDNIYATSGNVNMASQPAGVTGGSQPFSNLRPYLAMFQIIATSGVYPSRN